MSLNRIIMLNSLLKDEFDKFKGKSIELIKKELNITGSSKNINHVVAKAILSNSHFESNIAKLIKETNATVKTVNLEWNNNLRESVSLGVFKYMEIVQEEWSTSKLRSYFMNTVFIFFIFKKNSYTFLHDLKVWTMPYDILEGGVRMVWEDTKEKVSNGKIVNYIDNRGRFVTYFLTMSETKFIHVRPHAKNKNDKLPLPAPDKTTGFTDFVKHSFWLNSNFIKKILVDGKYYD